MSSAFQDVIAASQANTGKNFSFSGAGKEITFIQDLSDLQMLLKDVRGVTRKDLSWIRRAIGPSRVSEDGERWEIRRDLTQRHFSHFDRGLTRDGVVDIIGSLDNDADFTAQAGTIDGKLTYRLIIDVLLRTFFGVTLAESGIDPAVMRQMMLHAAYNSYLPDQNLLNASAEEREAYYAQLIRDRTAALEQLRALKEICADRSNMVRDIMAAEQASAEIVGEQEMLTIIAAGTESSAATLGWALFLLGQDQEFQDLCASHVDAELSDNPPEGRVPGGDPLDFLVDETLRRFPGFPFLSRTSDVDIPISDRTIPAGSPFVLQLLGHSYRDLYGDADSMSQLYRKSAEGRRLVGPNLAFGGGRRICAGMAFAKTELRLLLAAVMQRYRVVPTDDRAARNVIWQLSIVPAEDFSVKLAPRAVSAARRQG